MSFSMKLWQVTEGGLKEVPRSVLDKESRLEDWVRRDPSLLGIDLLIVGQQVMTHSKGFIDLLALDQEGNLVVLELMTAANTVPSPSATVQNTLGPSGN